MRSLSIGATGMLAQQLNVDVISNNIANMTTTGYKRQRAEFQDLLYQSLRRVGSASSDNGTIVPSGVQIGAGVQAAAVYRIHEQGNMQVTDNPLDIAISGDGFFQIELPNGETAYTRAGSFQISPEGAVVTADGYPVIGPGGIPEDAVEIQVNESGEILVAIDGQIEPQNVGQFELANFANEAGLQAIGDNLFLETPASGNAIIGMPAAAGFGSIKQGMLETSNVNIVSEITQLISAQRAYEMNSKVITAADEMMRSVSNLR
ncbi:MAG TPA: flagellar basal-body rod protein FlgG [Alphaproteobacteria bacterium]|nr:flagellar basal-body rod protein FlgG [Alphaproteobacteria bacterium]